MEGCTNPLRDGVLCNVAVVGQLEPMVQQQLVRQLLVGYATGERRALGIHTHSNRRGLPLHLVELLERAGAGNLLELGAEPRGLRVELDVQPRVSRLVWRELRLRLVKRDECMLEARCQLGGVGNPPFVEAANVYEQPRDEAVRQLVVHAAERASLHDGTCDAFQIGDERHSHIEERLLQRTHRLEDVRRPMRNHVGRQEHPHVDRVGSGGAGGWHAVAKQGQTVHALKEVLGVG